MAILYAERITGSMERAMAETRRRREKQVSFNEKHGITPKTIVKAVADIMEGARSSRAPVRGRAARAAEEREEYVSPDVLLKKAARLEKEMYRHARELEFEEAAQLRDEIEVLRKKALGVPDKLAV